MLGVRGVGLVLCAMLGKYGSAMSVIENGGLDACNAVQVTEVKSSEGLVLPLTSVTCNLV